MVAKKCYNSATDVYLTGLRGGSNNDALIATLLSNRAQAYLSLQQWAPAVADAAASLTLRPDSDKTWARYDVGLEKLREQLLKSDKRPKVGSAATTTRNLFRLLVPTLVVDNETVPNVQVAEAQQLKTKGNEAFRQKDHGTAVRYYTEALTVGGETTRAILSNWAFCALQTGTLGDVVSACTTSLRIGVGEKAWHRLVTALCRLGEHELAHDVLRAVLLRGKDNTTFQSLRDLEYEVSEPKGSPAGFLREKRMIQRNWACSSSTLLLWLATGSVMWKPFLLRRKGEVCVRQGH